jgi:hypothetical protein
MRCRGTVFRSLSRQARTIYFLARPFAAPLRGRGFTRGAQSHWWRHFLAAKMRTAFARPDRNRTMQAHPVIEPTPANLALPRSRVGRRSDVAQQRSGECAARERAGGSAGTWAATWSRGSDRLMPGSATIRGLVSSRIDLKQCFHRINCTRNVVRPGFDGKATPPAGPAAKRAQNRRWLPCESPKFPSHAAEATKLSMSGSTIAATAVRNVAADPAKAMLEVLGIATDRLSQRTHTAPDSLSYALGWDD